MRIKNVDDIATVHQCPYQYCCLFLSVSRLCTAHQCDASQRHITTVIMLVGVHDIVTVASYLPLFVSLSDAEARMGSL